MAKVAFQENKTRSRILNSLQFLNLICLPIAVVNVARNKDMYQCFRTFFTNIFSDPPDIVQVIELNRACSCNMVAHRKV